MKHIEQGAFGLEAIPSRRDFIVGATGLLLEAVNAFAPC